MTAENPVGKTGYTGNPGGRPKMPEELKRAFQSLAPEALKTLADVMANGKDSDRVKASEVILDRGYGKATQQIDANLEGSLQVINVGVPAFVKK
jgi:hypothetical protein